MTNVCTIIAVESLLKYLEKRPMTAIKQLLDTAQYAAIEAGKAIMQVYMAGEFSIEKKKDESPVTIADRNAHRVITQCLGKTNLPILSEEGINIDYASRKNWQYFWMIDPLDGTKEFINKIDEFTINIALVSEDTAIAGVVYVPATDVLYFGAKETGVYKIEKGVSRQILPLPGRTRFDDLRQKDHLVIAASRSHLTSETKNFIDQFHNVTLKSSGSSLKFMMILENRADIYPRLGRTMEWDTAAAHAILNACNKGVYLTHLESELKYNKPDLANPFFIAF